MKGLIISKTNVTKSQRAINEANTVSIKLSNLKPGLRTKAKPLMKKLRTVDEWHKDIVDFCLLNYKSGSLAFRVIKLMAEIREQLYDHEHELVMARPVGTKSNPNSDNMVIGKIVRADTHLKIDLNTSEAMISCDETSNYRATPVLGITLHPQDLVSILYGKPIGDLSKFFNLVIGNDASKEVLGAVEFTKVAKDLSLIGTPITTAVTA